MSSLKHRAPKLPSREGSSAASPGRFVSPIRTGAARGIKSPARYAGSPRHRSPGRLGATYSSPMRTLSPSRIASPSRTTSPSRTKSTTRTLTTIRHAAASSPSRSSSHAVISPARRRDATLAFGGARSVSTSGPGYVVTPLSLPPRQPRRSSAASSSHHTSEAAVADEVAAGLHPVETARLGVRKDGPIDVHEQRLRVAALEKWADEERQKLLEAEQRASRPFATGTTPHRVLVALGESGTRSVVTPAGLSADSIRESARQQNAVARRRLAEDRAMRREEAARNADAMLRVFQSPAERVQRALQAGDKMQHTPVRATRNYRHPKTYSDLLDGSTSVGETSGQLNLEPATPMTPPRDRAPPPPTPVDDQGPLQPKPEPEPELEPEPATRNGIVDKVEHYSDSGTDSDYSDSDD